jgi:hypothetical protein
MFQEAGRDTIDDEDLAAGLRVGSRTHDEDHFRPFRPPSLDLFQGGLFLGS